MNENRSPEDISMYSTGKDLLLIRCRLACRSSAIVLTMLAALLMGFDRQSRRDLLNPYSIKSTDSWAFLYFTATNAIVCLYSFASASYSSLRKSTTAQLQHLLVIADIVAAIILFTGNTVLIVVEDVAWNGNPHFDWIKICGMVKGFCGIAMAANVVSMVAAVLYFLLIVLSIAAIHRRSKF